MINLKKLLTEQVEPKQKVQEAADHVRSGLTKVFSAGEKEIPYRRVENVGLGYIRSVSEAIKCAVYESRQLASKYGYKDDQLKEMFVKESNDFSQLSAENPEHSMAKMSPEEMPHHDEMDMSNPEESREVQIAREILVVIDSPGMDRVMETEKGKLRQLAQQLLQIHGAK